MAHLSAIPDSVYRYETPFGDGWLGFRGHRWVATGLPRIAAPEAFGAAPAMARRVAALLIAYWQGGPLPHLDDRTLASASNTPLQAEIYRTVLSIQRGETMTYTEVAQSVGHPGAARAVGAAMARNPFAPLIPCHRVVGRDGTLRGYGGGVAMKSYLLELEAAGG